MITDDKAKSGGKGLRDNVNSRDQRNTGIILLVLTGIFLAFLISMGLSHAPAQHASETPSQAVAPGHASNDHHFDINRPIGYLELPGTIGKPQSFTSGVGNTPAPFTSKPQQGVSHGTSPDTAIDQASFGKAKSGHTASDAMPSPKPAAAPAAPAGH